MGFLDSDIPTVFTSGRAVSAQADSATTLAGRYLHSLTTATDFVKHPTVIAAIERYHTTWQSRVNQVASNIEALGGNTSASATTIAQSDDDAASALGQQGATTSTTHSFLQRPINGPF